MGHPQDSFRWQFQELQELVDQGEDAAAEALFEKLLRAGSEVFESLTKYIIEHPNEPRLAPLLELYAKLDDPRAAPILMRFLEIEVPELRIQAALGLGWLRARVALEKLDEMEGSDPDESVRHECRVAIEEILRDYPNLRKLCVHHEPLEVERRVEQDTEHEISQTILPSGDHRRRLAGIFPRLLARRLGVVPLWFGSGGVISFAMVRGADRDPLEDLRRLTGREVDLHAWPREKVYDWMLEFYDWGDDDWLDPGAELAEEALDEIASLVLEEIVPEDPHPALPDCADATEAAIAFLSICAMGDHTSAVVSCSADTGACRITVVNADGERLRLDPPLPPLAPRFFWAIKLLADLEGPRSIANPRTPHRKSDRGRIRCEHRRLEHPFEAAIVRSHSAGEEVLAMDFFASGSN